MSNTCDVAVSATEGECVTAAEPDAAPRPIRRDEPCPGVALITLDRPERLNALTVDLVSVLRHELALLRTDTTVRVVVLTGAGRAFCAGLDLNGYGEVAPPAAGPVQRMFAVQEHIAGLIEDLRRLPQPVICAANGPASGGGMALMLGSDLRIASRLARFNAAFVRIGLSACDIGTSWLLPRLVGAGRAHELMLTGRFVDAEEALAIGMVTHLSEPDQLLDDALALAETVLANSPAGVRMTKQVMWSALEIPGQRAAIDLENRTQVMLTQTSDHQEAMQAFLERRTPAFRDQ